MKQTLPVVGMACAACAANVQRKLSSLEGVLSVAVSLSSRSALVEYDPSRVSLQAMKEAVNSIGFDLVIEPDRDVVELEHREYIRLRRTTVLSWGVSLLVMAFSMHWIPVGSALTGNLVAMMLALAGLLCCGRCFYVSARKQLCHGFCSMDTLVALSTGITFLFSTFNTFWGDAVWGVRGIVWHTWFETPVMIITFVLTGRLLEEKAKNGAASAIRRLMGMAPKYARIVERQEKRDDKGNILEPAVVRQVPVSTIEKGDILEVRPGEKVPVDGEVIYAQSFMTSDAAYVDESMITGEPAPVGKKQGSRVLAGTIPCQGIFRMRARQIGEGTALSQIVRMVQQAQGSKAPVQRIVDKVSLVFVPLVATVALLTFLLWWIVGGNGALPHAILSAVAVLVVACPCAMGLATPTALMVGIGMAASRQILIKDATALENLCKVDALVIDKTGTLTLPNRDIDFSKADNLPLQVRESLKPNAREAIQELQQEGITVYMISGDREDAVEYWASKAGISHYQSQVLPQDKENLVKRLQDDGHRVAMVGDGINDTQALALADVGIAIGCGTDVAMDVAQVTLMGNDLQTLPEAVKLSRKTVRMIRQNLFWAFIYNIVCIPLAAGVLFLFGIHWQVTPMLAGALMAFSSVSVVLNSLRLKLVG